MGEIVEKAKQTENENLTLETFKKFVPYMRGALWWVRNDLLKERQSSFNRYDKHIGHPALSLRSGPVESRLDAVPMLTGTSGNRLTKQAKEECVVVTGMTAKDQDHKAYFGSIVEPGMYVTGELLDGVVKKDDVEEKRAKKDRSVELVRKPWYECRVMIPNWDKTIVDVAEMSALNDYCSKHGLNNL